ncbi:MAG: four helix bundle protein [Desulfobacterales bacterium]|nr:MAG: four helix bundle protein [Desulfobacterales bacterium]
MVWRKAHQFVLSIYRTTRHFPKEEVFGLTAQFRRAAISIPANIVEGFKRRGKKDKVRLMNIAQASLEECRYYCLLSTDLEYMDMKGHLEQLEDVSKLLDAYAKSILSSGS